MPGFDSGNRIRPIPPISAQYSAALWWERTGFPDLVLVGRLRVCPVAVAGTARAVRGHDCDNAVALARHDDPPVPAHP